MACVGGTLCLADKSQFTTTLNFIKGHIGQKKILDYFLNQITIGIVTALKITYRSNLTI